ELDRRPRRQRRRQRRLAVVDVTDGADVDVRLLTLEYTLCHVADLRMRLPIAVCPLPIDPTRHPALNRGCGLPIGNRKSVIGNSDFPKLPEGVEPSTSSLPRTRSTTELWQQPVAANRCRMLRRAL